MTLESGSTGARPPKPVTNGPLGVPEVVAVRLRTYREDAGMSVRALAKEVGVSASMVSQIENGKVNPSVGTLYALVNALGLSLDELFADSGGGAAGQDGEGTTRQFATASRMLRRSDRPSLTLASGVRWERLTPQPDPDVDFIVVTYDVGAASSPPDALMRHTGREYGLVLAGYLGATVGFDDYELAPGDSIAFESSTPHRFWTVGNQPTVVAWTIISRAGD